MPAVWPLAASSARARAADPARRPATPLDTHGWRHEQGTMVSLVLSTFSGVGMLDEAFREQGDCVVSAGDVLWGSFYDVRRFHPPSGVFDGVIGGPPCQEFSKVKRLVEAKGYETRFGNLIPEFERVVSEAKPRWWLMENVSQAPVPHVDGYVTWSGLLNASWLGNEQDRLRRFSFGTTAGLALVWDVEVFQSPIRRPAFTSKGTVLGPYQIEQARKAGSGHPKRVTYTLKDGLRLQGLPADFLDDAPFTVQGKMRVVANGVELTTGRAVARGVHRALAPAP